MNKFEYNPHDHTGWVSCTSCSEKIYEPVAYVVTSSIDSMPNYYCSEGCYIVYDADDWDEEDNDLIDNA